MLSVHVDVHAPRLGCATPQLDVLIAVLGLFLASVDATRPATR